MSEIAMQKQIDEINGKLDIILGEIGQQKRYRHEIEDLRDDLIRVGTDIYKSSLGGLEELTDTFEPNDLFVLGKLLLRNLNNFKEMFAQLESARDFMADFTNISSGMFNNVLLKLDELDRKGYFELMREMEKTLDTVASSFSAEDLKRINESLPVILSIVRRLSDRELIAKVEKAVTVFEEYDYDASGKVSTVAMVKDMMDPDVRQGMHYMLGLFKSIIKEYKAA